MDVWSNHACQVAFFPWRPNCSGGSVNFVLPRPQEMHPSATKGHVNQQAASCPRSASLPGGLAVTGFWARNAPYLPREGPSCWTFIFTDGHVQSSRIRWGRPAERQKAKTKASDPPPEENRPRGQPPDHQARRRSRKETLTQVAQNGRERVLGQHEEKKTQWMRTARKVQQRKPAPPMRKKPARIKKYQKNRDGF